MYVYMKNRVQRGSSLLLALACLLSLAACGEGSAETEAAETTADTAVTAETTEPELKDNLPALDYAGADMRILHFGSENAALKDAMGDDAGGDIVSDAVYNRNLAAATGADTPMKWQTWCWGETVPMKWYSWKAPSASGSVWTDIFRI